MVQCGAPLELELWVTSVGSECCERNVPACTESPRDGRKRAICCRLGENRGRVVLYRRKTLAVDSSFSAGFAGAYPLSVALPGCVQVATPKLEFTRMISES